MQLDRLLRIAGRGLAVERLGEQCEVICGAITCEFAHAGDLESRPCVMNITQSDTPVLQCEGRVARCGRPSRRLNTRPATCTAAYSDQTLRLEYPNRLAQSRTGHAELRHQLRFGGEGDPVRKFAANDPATQIHGNEVGGFRHADGWYSLSVWFAPRIPPRDRHAATLLTSIHRW